MPRRRWNALGPAPGSESRCGTDPIHRRRDRPALARGDEGQVVPPSRSARRLATTCGRSGSGSRRTRTATTSPASTSSPATSPTSSSPTSSPPSAPSASRSSSTTSGDTASPPTSGRRSSPRTRAARRDRAAPPPHLRRPQEHPPARPGRTYNKNPSVLRDFFKYHVLRGNLHGDPTLPIERAKARGVHLEVFSSATSTSAAAG
jgi:hypothetical protein